MNYISHQTKNFLGSNKSLFAIAVLLFSFTSTFAQENASSDKLGILSFDSEEIDYGNIVQHDNGERIFSFTNTGNAPVVISNVKTSCGCTVPTYPKTPILPGETGEIKVKYDTNRVGAFTKTITVMSNTAEPTKMLKIKGTISKDPS